DRARWETGFESLWVRQSRPYAGDTYGLHLPLLAYGHIDKHGRYRVNMLFDRARWETGFESLWVRQSRPYAGDTYGLHLPLLA
ncbi:hypothetical protein CQA78_30695, partial [Klebsiella pneumoniae]